MAPDQVQVGVYAVAYHDVRDADEAHDDEYRQREGESAASHSSLPWCGVGWPL